MYNRTDLRLCPSVTAGLLAGGPWLLLAVCLIALAFTLHPALAVLAIPALITGHARLLRCGLLRSDRAIVRLYREAIPASGDTPWTIELRDGSRYPVAVLGGSRVTGNLAVLALQAPCGASFGPLVLWGGRQQRPGDRLSRAPSRIPANCDATSFRRTRVWLRLGRDDKPARYLPSWVRTGSTQT